MHLRADGHFVREPCSQFPLCIILHTKLYIECWYTLCMTTGIILFLTQCSFQSVCLKMHKQLCSDVMHLFWMLFVQACLLFAVFICCFSAVIYLIWHWAIQVAASKCVLGILQPFYYAMLIFAAFNHSNWYLWSVYLLSICACLSARATGARLEIIEQGPTKLLIVAATWWIIN